MNVCSECKYRNPCEQLNHLDVDSTCSDLRMFVDEIRTDAIEECTDKFAEIMSNMPQICGRSCPVDCAWGTEETCKNIIKKWLAEQIKEQNDE